MKMILKKEALKFFLLCSVLAWVLHIHTILAEWSAAPIIVSYVSNTGSDAAENNCTNSEQPCRSMLHALNLMYEAEYDIVEKEILQLQVRILGNTFSVQHTDVPVIRHHPGANRTVIEVSSDTDNRVTVVSMEQEQKNALFNLHPSLLEGQFFFKEGELSPAHVSLRVHNLRIVSGWKSFLGWTCPVGSFAEKYCRFPLELSFNRSHVDYMNGFLPQHTDIRMLEIVDTDVWNMHPERSSHTAASHTLHITDGSSLHHCSLGLESSTAIRFKDSTFVNTQIFFAVNPDSVEIDECTFGNSPSEACLFMKNDRADLGRLSVRVTNSVFHNNSGGAIQIDSLVDLTILNTTFVDNNMARVGSPLQLNKLRSLVLQDCRFSNNNALKSNGGAVVINNIAEYDESVIDRCKFYNNSALNGGAIFITADVRTGQQNSFVSNRAVDHGGAIFSSMNRFTEYQGNFSSNVAGFNGGAIAIWNFQPVRLSSYEGLQETLHFINGAFRSNQASENGGALFLFGPTATVTLTRGEFNNNSAKSGGAIHIGSLQKFTIGDLTWPVAKIKFERNNASYGGAMTLKNLNDFYAIRAMMHFIGNMAALSGRDLFLAGTNHFDMTKLTDSKIMEPPILTTDALELGVPMSSAAIRSSTQRIELLPLRAVYSNGSTAEKDDSRNNTFIMDEVFMIELLQFDKWGVRIGDNDFDVLELNVLSDYNNIEVGKYLSRLDPEYGSVRFDRNRFTTRGIPGERATLQVRQYATDLGDEPHFSPAQVEATLSDCEEGNEMQVDDSIIIDGVPRRTCVPCNAGHYSNRIDKDHTERSKCVPCPAGHYARAKGTKECTPCPSGFGIIQNPQEELTSELGCVAPTLAVWGMVIGVFFVFTLLVLICAVAVLGLCLKRSKKWEKTELERALLGEDVLSKEDAELIDMLHNSMYNIKFHELSDIKQIGEGAQGIVLRAKWNKQHVAIKMFKRTAPLEVTEFGTDNAAQWSRSNLGESFLRELRTLSELRHPNLINYFGCCYEPPNRVGLVIEYAHKGSLDMFLSERMGDVFASETVGRAPETTGMRTAQSILSSSGDSALTWSLKMSLLLDICRGMSYLHNKGIMHRDLKCENVFVTQRLQAKVGDFGTARVISAASGLDETAHDMAEQHMTRQVGTSINVAPEVTRGENYTEKCDVFSFAIMFFQVITECMEPYGAVRNVHFRVANDGALRPGLPSVESVTEMHRQRFSGLLAESDANYAMYTPTQEVVQQCLSMMQQCWNHSPEERPSFEKLVEFFEEISAFL